MSYPTYENGEYSSIFQGDYEDSESISDFITKDFVHNDVKNDEKAETNEKTQSGHLFEGILLDDIEKSSFPNYPSLVSTFENSSPPDFDDQGFFQEDEKNIYRNTDNPMRADLEVTKCNQVYPMTEKVKSSSRSNIRVKNNPLLLFIDNPNSNMKNGKFGEKKKIRVNPKKEYYRTKLIRSWKKTIRTLAKPKASSSTAETLFQKHLNTNFSALSQISTTTSGPMTEAQAKRKEDQTEAKTYNNAYVFELFSNQIYLESFKLYVFSLFEGKTCIDLCQRFCFNCCIDDDHSQVCEERWNRLKNFSYSDLIGRFNN